MENLKPVTAWWQVYFFSDGHNTKLKGCEKNEVDPDCCNCPYTSFDSNYDNKTKDIFSFLPWK
ncbi:hypothetical protein KIS4809_1879 [Bacillus sp. ZZV12-4809]|nr:hypothetical protein KIS4809_1879 [Bacillus sp. ZZV12-4809]